ncbi:hypothetical protein [Kitasatospora phosalacinea]|uniref:Uncharacterized protein n=1 Tax=Kitasatospora phosalacinea TaxID=2065 RepID=A0A9W6PQD6_9ACTN|nr:hypothetical protein [Kitasatospora phosalacinea]GLW59395.1 hypothetical protein Kpho01_74050 [Kitasatospora phosalacinea]
MVTPAVCARSTDRPPRHPAAAAHSPVRVTPDGAPHRHPPPRLPAAAARRDTARLTPTFILMDSQLHFTDERLNVFTFRLLA